MPPEQYQFLMKEGMTMKRLLLMLLFLTLLTGHALAEPTVEVSTGDELIKAVSEAKGNTVIVLGSDIDLSSDDDSQSPLSIRNAKAHVLLDLNGHTLANAEFAKGSFEVENGILRSPDMVPLGGKVSLTLGEGVITRTISLPPDCKGSIEVVNRGVITGAYGLANEPISGCPATVKFVNEGVVDCGIGIYFTDENGSSGALTVVNNGTITGSLTGAWIRSSKGTKVSISGTGVLQGGCGVWIFGSKRSASISIDQQIRSGVGTTRVNWEQDGTVYSSAELLMSYVAQLEYMFIGSSLYLYSVPDSQDTQDKLKELEDRLVMLMELSEDETNENFYPELLTSFKNIGVLHNDALPLTESFGMALAYWNEDSSVQSQTNLTLKGSLWAEKALLMVPGESFKGKLKLSDTSAEGSPSRCMVFTCTETEASAMQQWVKKAMKNILGGKLPAGTKELLVRRQGNLYQQADRNLCYLPTAYLFSAEDMTLLQEDTALNPDNMLALKIQPVEFDARGIRLRLAEGYYLYRNVDIPLRWLPHVKEIYFDHMNLGYCIVPEEGSAKTCAFTTDRDMETQARMRFTDSVTVDKTGSLSMSVGNKDGLYVTNDADLPEFQFRIEEGSLKIDGSGHMDSLRLYLLENAKSAVIYQDIDEVTCFLGNATYPTPSQCDVVLEGQVGEITLNALQYGKQKDTRKLSFQLNCTGIRHLDILLYDPDVEPNASLTEAQTAALLRKHLPMLTTAQMMPEGETYELYLQVHTQMEDEKNVSYKGRAYSTYSLPAGNAVEILEQMATAEAEREQQLAAEKEAQARAEAERERQLAAMKEAFAGEKAEQFNLFMQELQDTGVSLPINLREIQRRPDLKAQWEQLHEPAVSLLKELIQTGSGEMSLLPEEYEATHFNFEVSQKARIVRVPLVLSEGRLMFDAESQQLAKENDCFLSIRLGLKKETESSGEEWMHVSRYSGDEYDVFIQWSDYGSIDISTNYDGSTCYVIISTKTSRWTGEYDPEDGHLMEFFFHAQ